LPIKQGGMKFRGDTKGDGKRRANRDGEMKRKKPGGVHSRKSETKRRRQECNRKRACGGKKESELGLKKGNDQENNETISKRGKGEPGKCVLITYRIFVLAG